MSIDMDQQFFAGLKPDFSLVVWKSDFPKSERKDWLPKWLPEGWESPVAPRNDSEQSIRQFFSSLLHSQGLLSQLEKIRRGRGKPADYGQFVRDAGRLIDHINGVDKPKIPHVPTKKKFNLREALIALKAIREKLFPSFMPDETDAGSKTTGPQKAKRAKREEEKAAKEEEERQVKRAWERAKNKGIEKKDFAPANGMTAKELDDLLGRIRRRDNYHKQGDADKTA